MEVQKSSKLIVGSSKKFKLFCLGVIVWCTVTRNRAVTLLLRTNQVTKWTNYTLSNVKNELSVVQWQNRIIWLVKIIVWFHLSCRNSFIFNNYNSLTLWTHVSKSQEHLSWCFRKYWFLFRKTLFFEKKLLL